MTTVHASNLLVQFAVMTLVSGAGYLAVFEPEQLSAFGMLLLDASSYGFSVGIFFLTLHAALLGYLIVLLVVAPGFAVASAARYSRWICCVRSVPSPVR